MPLLKSPLLNAVLHYPSHQRLPFHVPAHAGGACLPEGLHRAFTALGLSSNLLRHDLTELDGLDVLATPDPEGGCIHESQQLTAERWQVAHSFYLVNGSSGGLHAALLACVPRYAKVLLPRNVHRAVHAGVLLADATPVWCLPEWIPLSGCWGGLTLETLQTSHAQHPDLHAVVVTSPTYEGVTSPIASLAAYCHQHGLLLIVDEAHGAHFSLGHPQLPASACVQGADVVIQSTHKTLGSLTQTALLHLPKASRVSASKLQAVLGHVQTTSPSYVFLASLDAVSAFWHSPEGQTLLAQRVDAIHVFRETLTQLLPAKGFALLPYTPERDDPFRLLIRAIEHHPAEAWAVSLEEEHGLSFERTQGDVALYLAQLLHAPTVWEASLAVWQQLPSVATPNTTLLPHPPPLWALPEQAQRPREAFEAPHRRCAVSQAVGHISAETVVCCPPGIPIVTVGERINEDIVAQLTQDEILIVVGTL
ncbi:MAG: aminotransferase class I/II-fold pyridoxal phosphate-dependent enzyme [Vampirovibrionales bacterium]